MKVLNVAYRGDDLVLRSTLELEDTVCMRQWVSCPVIKSWDHGKECLRMPSKQTYKRLYFLPPLPCFFTALFQESILFVCLFAYLSHRLLFQTE